ncbi:MAG: V-type ATP synthase subunit I [Synergistaceae bacterium]|jgi:V/A-type H+-transporting ATPase subunit I|nr:V-type ATP synthase subunit I [Synergistaceae bacterium]
MAIAEMQKARIAIHKSISDELLKEIQRLGCCQFIAQTSDSANERDAAAMRSRLRHIDDLLGEVRFASRFIEPYAAKKTGGIAKALGDCEEFSLEQLSELAAEESFMALAAKLRDLEKRLSDAKSGSSRVAGLRAALQPLAGLPYSLDFYSKGTDRLQGSLFSVPAVHAEEFRRAQSGVLGDMAEIYSLPLGEKDSSQLFSVICPREMGEAVSGEAMKFQAAKVDVPPNICRTAREELGKLSAESTEYSSEEASVIEEITESADDVYRTCQYCGDYWGIEKARIESLISGEQTERILVMTFWIPKSKLNEFDNIASRYSDLVEVVPEEPGEGETPPTLLRNKGMSVPVEPLIEMYGTPTYGGIDPTAIVAPFFYAFFGICFGDAGYGLLIAALLTAVLMKKKVTGTLRKFFHILIIGNVCALAFGVLTFSWFGDSITAFSFLGFLKPLQKLQILDPMNDPTTMLFVSLAFGFIQIMAGLFIALRENLKKGDKMAAFADQGGWIVFLCGLVLSGLSSSGAVPLPTGLCTAIAVVGALILIFTQGRSKESFAGKAFSGVISLYNVTSYLGDLLSYSRLLALGLGSAAVGMVINMLANLVSDGLPTIGWIIGLLIFLVGHVFSIAVNLLGAFVHSLRLQYVEFFSKFYEASGEEYSPLSLSTQYVRLKE